MGDQRTKALHATFRGRVVLTRETDGDALELPISAVQATFVLNAMPQAQIVVPVGEDAITPGLNPVRLDAAFLSKMLQFRHVVCYVRITGEFAPGASWPEDEIRVFNGYLTAATTVRTHDSLGVMLEVTHWLADLDASSTLSEAISVGAPLAFVLPPTSVTGNILKYDPSDPNLTAVTQDFWNGALKPKLIQLATEGTLADGLNCAPDAAAGLGFVSNNLAIQRLQGSGVGIFDQSELIDVPKIAFVGDDNPWLRDQICVTVMDLLSSASLGRSSMWDKLLEVVDEFQLSLIPTIDSATIAPLMPCLAGDSPPRHITIYADEQFSLQPSMGVVRIWRGVAMLGQLIVMTGALDYNQINNSDFNPNAVGCYLADKDESLPEEIREAAARGTLRYSRPPAWLDDVSIQGGIGIEKSLSSADISHSMQMPDDFVGPPAADDFVGPPAPAEFFASRQTLGQAYARWWYWANQFRMRNGELEGKLRFDIAPGTSVRIEDPAAKASTAEPTYLYGVVSSVRFNIDAINQSAGTSFTLTGLRRHSERRLGDEQHPLYKGSDGGTRWVGTVLQRVEMQGRSERFVPLPGSHESP